MSSLETANPIDPSLKPVPYSGIQYVGIPEFPAIATQVGQLMAKVIRGELPVDDALVKAQEVARNQMSVSRYIR